MKAVHLFIYLLSFQLKPTESSTIRLQIKFPCLISVKLFSELFSARSIPVLQPCDKLLTATALEGSMPIDRLFFH